MAPLSRSVFKSGHERARRRIVQTGERFVEQREPRIVNQRALQCHALPHPAREARDRILAAVSRPALSSAARARRIGVGDPIEAGEEREVLARRQLRIQEQIVSRARRCVRATLVRRLCRAFRSGWCRRRDAAALRASRGAWTSLLHWDRAARGSCRATRETSCATPRAGGRSGGRRLRLKLRRSRRSSRRDALTASLRSRVGLVELAVNLFELAEDAGATPGLCVRVGGA